MPQFNNILYFLYQLVLITGRFALMLLISLSVAGSILTMLMILGVHFLLHSYLFWASLVVATALTFFALFSKMQLW